MNRQGTDFISETGIVVKTEQARIGNSMTELVFAGPPAEEDGVDLLAACGRQLQPAVHAIVQSAVAAGWREEDVLLSLVELTWEMYEQRRGDGAPAS